MASFRLSPAGIPSFRRYKNTNAIQEGGDTETVSVLDPPAPISCSFTPAGIRGTSKVETRFRRGRKTGKGRLDEEGCSVMTTMWVTLSTVVQGKGGWGSEHLGEETLPKELQGVEN